MKADLEVIKIENYTHNMRYDPPVRPSPNLPNLQSIYLYPSLAFLEKTEVSVGRGTKIQFQIYGHPDFKSGFSFTPMPNFGSQNPKLNGKLSFGEDLRQYETNKIVELQWLIKSYDQISDKNNFFRSDFDKLSGTSNLKKQIIEGLSESEIREAYNFAHENNLIPPSMEQPQYNLLDKERFEIEYDALYKDFGMGTTTWSPLASGALTGKYLNGIPDNSSCLLYTSPSPRDRTRSRMPSSA